MNDRTAVKMVQERMKIADHGRQEYAANAIENEKYYINYIDETTHPYLSNIALPWPYIIVESYLGKCIQMLAAMMPYVRVVEEDDDSRQKAKKVEKDANMVLYLQRWPILAYNLYKQAFKYGTTFVLEQPWGNFEGREMPIFSIMNWFHTWVNPSSISLSEDDAFLIYEMFVPEKTLKRFKNNPNYKNIGKIETHDGRIYTPEEEEIRSSKSMPVNMHDPYSKLVKVWYYWDNENMIFITNEENCIRNTDNMVGAIPCKVIKPIPIENEFYGMSILEEGKGLFTEANENRNQFNDAVNLMLNPQWIVSRGADLKQRTIVSKSGNCVFVDDVAGMVPMKVDWNILTASMNRHRFIENDIQNYSNAFPQMRGAPQGGSETATEFMGMRSAGELRSDTYNLLLSMMSVEEMVRDIVTFKKTFMTEENSFFYWPEDQTEKVGPMDYNGNFTFKAYAGYKQAKEIERNQFIQALTFIFGNQAFLPRVLPRVDEWLDRLLDYFGIRNPEQLWVSEQEGMMNQMYQMMNQMGMLPGQKPQLALGEKASRTQESTPNSPMGTMISNEIMR